jgi:hypothetical protein
LYGAIAGGERREEAVDVVAKLEMIEERLHRDAGAGETGGSAEDLGIGADGVLGR